MNSLTEASAGAELDGPTSLRDWEGIPTWAISDGQGRFNAMDSGLRLLAGEGFLGRAWTVRTMAAENSTLQRGLDTAPAGSALVVDAGGYVERAVWGEIKTVEAIRRRLAGLVLDGATRNLAEIRSLGFPIYARGVCIPGPNKGWHGEVGGQIVCGGVVVNPGDIVVGDLDGVVLVPRRDEADVLIRARELMGKYPQRLAEAKRGNTG